MMSMVVGNMVAWAVTKFVLFLVAMRLRVERECSYARTFSVRKAAAAVGSVPLRNCDLVFGVRLQVFAVIA